MLSVTLTLPEVLKRPITADNSGKFSEAERLWVILSSRPSTIFLRPCTSWRSFKQGWGEAATRWSAFWAGAGDTAGRCPGALQLRLRLSEVETCTCELSKSIGDTAARCRDALQLRQHSSRAKALRGGVGELWKGHRTQARLRGCLLQPRQYPPGAEALR